MHPGEETAGEIRLRQFLEQETEPLLRTLRVYVARAGLASAPAVIESAADELLNEVTVEALAHADRFRPDGQPRAWLLGIAANLIKRKQSELARRERREPLARDMVANESELDDGELFDRFVALARNNPADEFEENETVEALLSRLMKADRHVVRMAVLRGMDGRELAKALGVSPGAARVRLHRALGRLREAILALEGGEAQ